MVTAAVGVASPNFAPMSLWWVLHWFAAERAALQPAAGEGSAAPCAASRLFSGPAVALLVLVVLCAAVNLVFDFKYSSFLWESLPSKTIDGQTYAWPGVYGAERLEPDALAGESWRVTGGPYVPLPTEAPDAAAARVVTYLHDRFDVDADADHVERVLADNRGMVPPPGLRASGGELDHPYTAGLAQIEEEYSGAVLCVLLSRTLALLSLLVVVGAAVIRVGVGRFATWLFASRLRGITTLLAAAALIGPSAYFDLKAEVIRAGAPLFQYQVDHVATATAVALALAGLMLWSSYRRAVSVTAVVASGA